MKGGGPLTLDSPPRSNYCAILRVCSWQEDLLPPPQEPQGWARGEAWDLEGHPEPRWGRGRDPGQRQCVGQGVPSAPPRRSLNRTLRPTQAKARSVPPPPLCLRSLRILHPDTPPPIILLIMSSPVCPSSFQAMLGLPLGASSLTGGH